MPKLSSSTSATVVAATPKSVDAPVKTPKVKTETSTKKTAAAAPVVVDAAAAAPAATPAPKKKAAKTATAAAPAAVVAPTPTENTVVATETTTASAASSEYTEFMNKLHQASTLLSSLRSDFRSLEKKNSRDLKLANKANAKRARKQKGNRSPSGFVKPTLISPELSTFLGKETGTQMARTEVTREINTYIRANSLQDKENGRKINADEKLSALLKLGKGEELTYFNLQRYMSPHFIKTVAAAVVVA
jgi:chromatin remodeling complex protein RSC6